MPSTLTAALGSELRCGVWGLGLGFVIWGLGLWNRDWGLGVGVCSGGAACQLPVEAMLACLLKLSCPPCPLSTPTRFFGRWVSLS